MAEHYIPRPRLACEITAERVIAARAADGAQSLEASAAQRLPEGALTPGLTQANIGARETLLTALRESLAAVATRSGDLCLVIPDAATRIMLLDFDTLPDKPQEADAVVRFRLKKSLPFDVDQSSISFDRQGTVNPVRVVAAVTPRAVLEEYESLVREVGYNRSARIRSPVSSRSVLARRCSRDTGMLVGWIT